MTRLALAIAILASSPAFAATRCDRIVAAFGNRLADAVCFESLDLTTNNPATTPANNSIAGIAVGAFTPQTDRGVISPNPPNRTPIIRVVPGIQLDARVADDPTGEARFVLRLPDDWNGRLVVAGASGNRSEFNGDFAWSDYVVQKGYAYASQNKGVLNLQLLVNPTTDPLACRLNPTSPFSAHFYANDPGQVFTRWAEYMIKAGKLAQKGAEAAYGREPRHTYAVGTSNGGYQVRRAVELAPDVFDGGVEWEGTFVDEHAPNILTDLPAAVLNFPDYVASNFDPNSTAAKNIRGAGYPPDPVTRGTATNSLWLTNSNSFWEVTGCQWQKRLDPAYDTYGSGVGNYNYVARLSASDVGGQMASFATTGAIKRPLITLAGTLDSLLPIDHHARAYARKVAAASAHNKGQGHDGDDDDHHDNGHGNDRPAYRLYEVQNGNHLETNQLLFPQIELIQPHAQRAFDLLVEHVDRGRTLPPSQCIGRGAAIADAPAQSGHCTQLLAP